MGLFVDRVRFQSNPPEERVILAELAARTGSSDGVDAIAQDGNELQLSTLLDPVTRPYLLKILIERGAVRVDHRSRQPLDTVLPWYVAKPWKEHPVWTRAWIRLAFLLGLASTALPRRG